MLPDDPDAQARLFYLALLGMVIASGVFYNYRNRLGAALQHAVIWVLIFLGAMIAYGFKDQLTLQLYPDTAQIRDGRTIALHRAEGVRELVRLHRVAESPAGGVDPGELRGVAVVEVVLGGFGLLRCPGRRLHNLIPAFGSVRLIEWVGQGGKRNHEQAR